MFHVDDVYYLSISTNILNNCTWWVSIYHYYKVCKHVSSNLFLKLLLLDCLMLNEISSPLCFIHILFPPSKSYPLLNTDYFGHFFIKWKSSGWDHHDQFVVKSTAKFSFIFHIWSPLQQYTLDHCLLEVLASVFLLLWYKIILDSVPPISFHFSVSAEGVFSQRAIDSLPRQSCSLFMCSSHFIFYDPPEARFQLKHMLLHINESK